MAVKIRLTRLGAKKTPFFFFLVADSRKARDGEVIETLGTFNPLTDPAEIKIDVESAKKWIANRDQPTETAKSLLVKAGVIEQSTKKNTPKNDKKKKESK